jgi:hypothetical protein
MPAVLARPPSLPLTNLDTWEDELEVISGAVSQDVAALTGYCRTCVL